MRTHFTSLIQRRSAQRRLWGWSLSVLALLVSLTWCASHHFVKTSKGWVVVSKRFVGFSGTWADVRGWTWEDVVAHPDLSQALRQAGYADMLPDEPTLINKTLEKAKAMQDEVIRTSTHAWQALKTKMAKPEDAQTTALPESR